MKKNLSKLASIFVPLLLGVGLIVYQYNSFSAAELDIMRNCFREANYFYIYLSLFVALFGFLSRAYRWKYSIEHLGYKSKFHNNLMAVCICYFVNLSIPRSGEISRALILKKYENIPFDKGFGTIIAERVIDTIIFLLIVIVSFLIQYDVLKEFIIQHIPLKTLTILGVIGVCSMLIAFYLYKYSKWKLILTIKEKFSGLIEGVKSVFQMKKRWKFLFHSLFIWATYFLMFYISVFALKQTENIGFKAVIIGFVIGSLATGFTNSGFGAFPYMLSQIFLLYNIAEPVGSAFGWLVWTSQTALMITLGALSFLFLPLLNRK